MKIIIFLFFATFLLFSYHANKADTKEKTSATLAEDVKNETLRTWNTYTKYAWPHDGLLPISKTYHDWYAQSINMSPIDAYSTLKVMGLDNEAARIEKFVMDSLNFNKDISVKVFEVDILWVAC